VRVWLVVILVLGGTAAPAAADTRLVPRDAPWRPRHPRAAGPRARPRRHLDDVAL